MTANHFLPHRAGVLLVIALLASVGQPETSYVDARRGSDMNPGAEAAPLQTLKQAAVLVNESKEAGPATIIVASGLYCLNQCVTFGGDRAFTETSRLTIRSAALPDDSEWRPKRMPVIISMENPRPSNGLTETYSLKIQTSHATIQGLKFLGNPTPNNMHACVERIGNKLDDLLITQCTFAGHEHGADINAATLATGDRVVVDHCIFVGCHACTVSWDGPEGLGGNGCVMRYCIVDGALISGVWTCQTAEDFEFHHNLVTRSQYLWMRKAGDRQQYRIADCVVIDNEHFSGYGTASGPTGQTGDEVSFEQVNVVTRGSIVLETERTARDYLHIVPGTLGSDLGAGLFTHVPTQPAKSGAPSYGSNPDNGAYRRINGARIYYERYGRGSPILLLHGGFSHIATQATLIEMLAKHYEVIAVDTRGHGRSTGDDQPMTYPLLADDMAKLLDELDVGPVTVVGHSDGGVIGYVLAVQHPMKVRALVANGANFRKEGRGGITPGMNEWIKTITLQMVEQWGDIRGPYERLNPEADWEGFVAAVKALWQSETELTEQDLKRIRCPVLISHGDRDSFVKLADIVWMYEQIENAELYVAPDGGHGHHRDQIEAFGPIVLRFLQKVTDSEE